MKKILHSTIAAAAAFGLALGAYAGAEVGKAAPDFTLTDLSGQTHKLSDYAGKTVVLEWTNDGCPFVKKHYGSGNMQKLQADYTAKGVIWLQVLSSAPGKQGNNHPAGGLQKLAEEQKHASTALLLDGRGTVARLYDAKTTPHLFVINPAGLVVYNGAIDSIPSSNAADIPKAENYVAAALDATLAGKPVATAVTKPYGCDTASKLAPEDS